MWEDKKLVRERKGGRPRQREPCVKAQIIESARSVQLQFSTVRVFFRVWQWVAECHPEFPLVREGLLESVQRPV